MGWGDLMIAFTDLPQLAARNDDDGYDRLSHRWTAAKLIVFAVIVSTSQYVGDPIHCWCPAHFHDSWEKYADSYCWVRNTYYLPFSDDIPLSPHDREKWPVIYYQWVPLILLVQAMFFYLPITLWRSFNSRTGLDVNDIVETSEKLQVADDLEGRSRILQMLTNQMHRYIKTGRRPLRNDQLYLEGHKLNLKCICSYICCCCLGKRFGNYLVLLYICLKIVFLGNIVLQLFFLDRFIGNSYHSYGYDVIMATLRGEDWTDSPRFPRITLCDMEVRRLGNVQRYSLQCVMTINLFNEKIYLYLWFWLIFVGVISLWGFFGFLGHVLIPGETYRYVRNILMSHGSYSDSDKSQKLLNIFVNEYLKQDGVFVLRLVDLNTSKITVREYTSALWEHFKDNIPKNNGKMIELNDGLLAEP